jgi:uncharacterized protein YggU (UPF0235/DUF167 family)
VVEDSKFYEFRDGKTYVAARVTTRASLNAITGERGGYLLVSVTCVPENNKANSEVIKLLSKALGVPKSKMQIISGAKCKTKVICIDGIHVFS